MSKDKVVLKGDFIGKTLENKHLVYKGDDLTLANCKLNNCTFGIDGEASKGVDFMKKLFNAGVKCAVMKTFLTDEEYEIVKDALGWHGKDGN